MVPEVKEKNILVTNSQGIMTNAVASTALAFVFGLARGFQDAWNAKLAQSFNRTTFDQSFENIQDVFGQSCLIAGFGEIGQKISSACAALGMEVSTIRKNAEGTPSWVKKVYSVNQLPQAVRKVDYVINILPLVSETRHIYNAEVFYNMKKTAFFINVGRGDSVVEKDLLQALKTRTIAGAGLDVFQFRKLCRPFDTITLRIAIPKLEKRYFNPSCSRSEFNLLEKGMLFVF